MHMKVITGFLFAALSLLLTAPVASNERDSTAVTASPVAAAELAIGPVMHEAEGLSSLTTKDRDTGANFKVYFDNPSAKIARQSIPTLAAFYREVAELVMVNPADVHWGAVLFARNADALILTRKPGESVWKVNVEPDGSLGRSGIRTLFVTVPHEQTHATQHVGHDAIDLPRWFAEGQASWVELQVATRWKPALAKERRAQLASALASSKEPVALSQWGGFRPKPEAILRQLTPEQRKRFLEDPSSVKLLRTFHFNDDDFAQDESNTLARYGASLAVFERIDKQAGRKALMAWFQAIRQAKPPVNSDQLAALALEYVKIDIKADLN